MSEKTETAVSAVDSVQHWFAAKVFHNRLSEIKELLESEGYQWYVAVHKNKIKRSDGRISLVERPLISSLIFFKSTIDETQQIGRLFNGRAMIYQTAGEKRQPAIIPEKEMEIFMLVTSADFQGLEYLGSDTANYSIGDKVEVTGGPFKGAIGRIFRIKGDKRLVVTIHGVCAVATSYIPASLLKKI